MVMPKQRIRWWLKWKWHELYCWYLDIRTRRLRLRLMRAGACESTASYFAIQAYRGGTTGRKEYAEAVDLYETPGRYDAVVQEFHQKIKDMPSYS